MHKSVTNGHSPFNFHGYFNEVQQSLNSRSTVVQQSFNSRSTVVQQSFNSRSTVVQQSFNSRSTVVQQSFNSRSTVVQQSFNSRSTVVQQSFNSRSTVVQQSFNSRSTVVQQSFAVFSLQFFSSATNNFIVERMLPHLILYKNVSTLSIITFFNAVTAVTITANTIVASALMLVWQYCYITFVILTPLLF